MTLIDDTELANTRGKLKELEMRYAARCHETPGNPHVHDLTLQSLRRLINQLKEEIARYEAHRTGRREAVR
ncbi:MAG: hypothetical protein HOP29_00925 [Phycisphaerales bacterium]|nr:hypothetical protein [Phycisphaerales bacterium]